MQMIAATEGTAMNITFNRIRHPRQTGIALLAVLSLCLGSPSAKAATFTVDSTENDGTGTLRWAITQANEAPGADTIVFDLPDATIIAPTSELPALATGETTIDGGGTIRLSGLSAFGGTVGLRIESNGNTIKGLQITSWQSHGIYIAGDENRVSGCTIGTDGFGYLTNLGSGVYIHAGDYNKIGYTQDGGEGNLISGNNLDGIHSTLDARYTTIAGNRVGITATGASALPNFRYGVQIAGVGVRVGGTTHLERNYIAGNVNHEIFAIQLIADGASYITGNYIGLATDGETPIYSQASGIALGVNADYIQVGGSQPGEGNVICCNAGHGIEARGVGNTIKGNRIGFSAMNGTPLPNSLNGIILNGQHMLIGGDDEASANTIANNERYGIQVINSQFSTFRRNSIYNNTLGAIDMLDQSNNQILPPTINTIYPLAGTTVPDGIVDFYADFGTQTQFYVGTVNANPNGAFSIDLSLASFFGLSLTATVTGPAPGNNTSALAEPQPIFPCCEGEGEGEGQSDTQSADQDGNFIIDLSELLRVIQFYNSNGLHCAETPQASEDGYLAGAGTNTACQPHSTDYDPQDWIINLSELLRLIQIYNSGGYRACPGEGTEDGFCPGLA